MALVLSAPVTFEAGSRPEEVEAALALCRAHREHCLRSWYQDEKLRPVRIQPFLLDRHEVTKEQFASFVADSRYRTTAEKLGYAWAWDPERHQWKKQAGASWRTAQSDGRAPVTTVSRADAVAYCRFRGKRLPTANEWEYAARGDARRVFPWGNEWEPERVAAAHGTSNGARPERLAAGATPLGIHALAGGVWEWTSTNLGDEAVLKGGSWAEENPASFRGAVRRRDDPLAPHTDDGFRCARDV